MEGSNLIKVTFMLSAVAGYCDTVTFVAGGNVFSAHVTGNFIVFAHQLIMGADTGAWVRLLTFPVFIIAVITGGWMASKNTNGNRLLIAETVLLATASFMAKGAAVLNSAPYVTEISIMLVVFAMGLQNAFGKLYSKATIGPTTVMTGNVTQAALDLKNLFIFGKQNTDALSSLKKQGILISGFTTGCILGAIGGSKFGISAVFLAGITILVCYIVSGKNTTKMV